MFRLQYISFAVLSLVLVATIPPGKHGGGCEAFISATLSPALSLGACRTRLRLSAPLLRRQCRGSQPSSAGNIKSFMAVHPTIPQPLLPTALATAASADGAETANEASFSPSPAPSGSKDVVVVDEHTKPVNENGNNNTPLRRMRKRKVKIYTKRRRFNVALLFSLWYVLSVGFNICSKRALNLAPNLAWTAAWFQMALGLLYVLPLWSLGVRSRPVLSPKETQVLLPVAILHSLVHVGGVVSMSAGAVSFTYIVKSSEPAVSAALSAALVQSYLPLGVYLTLIPVMAGVALTSISELTFSRRAFNYAMMSNVASATRGIVGKKTLSRNRTLGRNMNATNMYAVLTILSALILLPITVALEGRMLLPTMTALASEGRLLEYAVQTLLAAIFYYTYNEVAFLCLDNVSPVSHALANTLKRVFIIISSMVVFGNKMTAQGVAGSILAVGGVLLYSLVKHRYKMAATTRKAATTP